MHAATCAAVWQQTSAKRDCCPICDDVGALLAAAPHAPCPAAAAPAVDLRAPAASGAAVRTAAGGGAVAGDAARGLECPICYERMTAPLAPACGHLVCAVCTDVVINRGRCVVCEARVVRGDLRRIFVSA